MVACGEVARGKMDKSKVELPFCNLCQAEVPAADPTLVDEEEAMTQTTHHIFAECEALATARLEILGAPFYIDLEKVEKRKILAFLERVNIAVFPSDNEEMNELNSIDINTTEDEEL